MTLKPSFAQHNCCDCKLICKIAQTFLLLLLNCSSFYYDYGNCIHCSSTGVDSQTILPVPQQRVPAALDAGVLGGECSSEGNGSLPCVVSRR